MTEASPEVTTFFFPTGALCHHHRKNVRKPYKSRLNQRIDLKISVGSTRIREDSMEAGKAPLVYGVP